MFIRCEQPGGEPIAVKLEAIKVARKLKAVRYPKDSSHPIARPNEPVQYVLTLGEGAKSIRVVDPGNIAILDKFVEQELALTAAFMSEG